VSVIAPTKTAGFNLEVIQADIRAYLHERPQGVLQSDLARNVLGIPQKVDKNWITYYVLQNMLEDGQITRNDMKLFHLA